MTQPSAAIAKLVDKNNNPQIADRIAAITAAVESHTIATSPSESVNRADLKAHFDALGVAINAIISVLEEHGLIADN